MRYAVLARNYVFEDLPEYVLFVYDSLKRKEVIKQIISMGLEPIYIHMLFTWFEKRLFTKYSKIKGADYPTGICSLDTNKSSEKDK